MRLFAPLFSMVLAVAVPVAASALTLEECLALARRHAPVLRIGDANVSRAAQAVREARAALALTLRLGASLVQNNEAPKVVFTPPGATSSQVIKFGSASSLDIRTDAQITLYSGGRRDHPGGGAP